MMNDTQTNCESYETLISTWVDEGLEHGGQRELLDHLVRCPACRGFYADARALEGLVALAGSGATGEEPAPEIWQRIRSRTEDRESSGESWPSWAWRAAAALLIGAALAFAPWPTSSSLERSGEQVEVILEEDRGLMTEGRFVELAAELLRADRRYHFAMQEVMDKVIDDQWEPEGVTSEGHFEESAKDEEAEDEKSSPFRV